MRDITPALQECNISKSDLRIGPRRFQRVCILAIGQFVLSALLISQRQQHQQLRRLGLVVKGFAQIGDGAIDLPLVDSDGCAKSQGAYISTVFLDNSGNDGLRGCDVTLSKVELGELYLRVELS